MGGRLTLSESRRRVMGSATALVLALGAVAASARAWAVTPSPPSTPSPAASTISARIEPHRAQTIAGIGVSDDRWSTDLFAFPPAIRRRVGHLLFAKDGLDLSAYRYAIGAGSGSPGPPSFLVRPWRYDWSANAGGDFFLRLAARMGVRLLVGYVNSAPGVWTTNGRDCGGWLRPESVADYARYLTDVVAHLHHDLGITLSYVSPMNEPDWNFPRCWQQGMHVAIPERTTILSDLERDLAARARYAKVVADESSHLVTQLLPEIPRWLSDPDAARSLAGFAYHDYGPPNPAALRELVSVEHRYGKPAWMTEICCQDGHLFGASYDPTMTGALWMADRLWMDLTFGDVSSVDWWRALSPSLGCDPSVHPGCAAVPNPSGWDDGLLYYDPHFSSNHDYRIHTTKRFFVFANFSRYVRPGFVRRPVSPTPPDLRVVAFSSGSRWRVVVIDDAAPSRGNATLRLVFPRMLSSRLVTTGAVRTSPTEDLASIPAPALDATSRTMIATIAPQSVTTFLLATRAVRTPASGLRTPSSGLRTPSKLVLAVVALAAVVGIVVLPRRPKRRRRRLRAREGRPKHTGHGGR